MIIGGLQKTSTIDFPGVLSCIIFTRGCNLDCFYCHNRELLSLKGEQVQETEVMEFLQKRRGLLDGIVISGGEPTLQKDLAEFIAKIKLLGFSVKLDTNGQNTTAVAELCASRMLDYVAVDLKALPEEYSGICGVAGYASAVNTIMQLKESRVSFEVRTTLYPGFSTEMLENLLAGLPTMPRWRLNYFKMPEVFNESKKTMLEEACLDNGSVRQILPRLLNLQANLIC